MKPLRFSVLPFALPITCLVAAAAVAQPLPEKALKYHEVLLKRPHNAALFDRLFGAWIDEQPVETLGTFLEKQAAENGGANWTVLATYQLRRGNEDAALASLAKGIAAQPGDLALPMERGKLRLRRLELAAAREDFAKVAAGPDEALALEAAKLTGKAWLREGKTAEAVKAWDAVLAAHPGDEDLLEDLVETAAAESEIPQALIYAEKLIAASHDPYQKTLRQLRRADLLARAGRDDDAVEACVATLAQVGDGSWLEREVLAQIDKILRKQDRVADLATRLKALAETYPQRLAIHRQLAKLEASQGQVDEAIGRFREVLKRSPGERELREEFVRLLTDAERFDDASAELEKLIEAAPTDANLLFQLAALRSRQDQPDAVAAALEKARTLLGGDESAGLRVAGLLLQYGLAEKGVALLESLAAAPAASPAALEALAGHYGRTNRKDQAIKLLQKVAAAGELDGLLRAAGSISALGESAAALETLTARADQFPAEPRFLAALSQAALAAGKPADAVPPALKLVHLATQPTDLAEAISLASRATSAAEKSFEVREALAAQATRTAAETCFLAALADSAGDFEAVGKLLETNADPLVIRFYAALLDRRGDADAAIAVLTRLADTPEGKKAAYFKDLSDLQQRAGQSVAALATVERWKLAAPGDKSAWIAASRLLRETGKLDDAVRTLRQAVGRFDGDADLAASLAALHTESGQTADAEAIYWKLYDDAQSPGDQARWAAQLAQLAQRTATTAALEEKLRERARSNRRALGPILALAELARVTNEDDKRRDLLLEAVRLQPKDLDLRLQIANLEEQAGNPDRVLAVLQDALPFDVDNRVRGALAQAYLRQGEALKGMRELRLLAGKSGFDTRSAEAAAGALASTKLYDEAITLLRTELTGGGDWRSRYLLAVLLEEDGREAEAVPLFLDLLRAEGEIPGLVPPQTGAVNPYQRQKMPPQVEDIQRLMQANQLAYQHRNASSGGYYGYLAQTATAVGGFFLPNSPEDVRQFALIHLATLAKKPGEATAKAIQEQVKASGYAHWDFLTEIMAANTENNRNDVSKAVVAHLQEPGVLAWFMANVGFNQNHDPETAKALRVALENGKGIDARTRFLGWLGVMRSAPADEAGWKSLLAAADALLATKSLENAGSVLGMAMYLLQDRDLKLPEAQAAALKQRVKQAFAQVVAERPEMAHGEQALQIVALTGTPDEWLAELNVAVRESRKPSTAPQGFRGYRGGRTRLAQMLQYSMLSRGYNPWNSNTDVFEVPTLDNMPVRSLPPNFLAAFTKPSEDEYQGQGSVPVPFTVAQLVARAAEIESPFLRAWLAAKAGDKAALTKALAADVLTQETFDMAALRAVLALQDKKPLAAFDALLVARAASGPEREISTWTNAALIAVAQTLTPEERASRTDDLQAAFLQLRQDFGVQGAAPVLAAKARQLGFEDLAQRINVAAPRTGGPSAATGAATLATAQPSSSGVSSSGNPAEKIRKFVGEKKYEAAAREVLQAMRGQAAQRNSSFSSYQLPEMLESLGKEGQAELLKLVDPGDSKSLVRRLEYVDICSQIGKPELALVMLEELAKERPDDGDIAARLAFLVPADQMDRRLELITKASQASEFVNRAADVAGKLDHNSDNAKSLEFFEMVTRWLETADPKAIAGANLTWVNYYGKNFFEGGMTSSLPLPTQEMTKVPEENREQIERYHALCRRLATAMMRHAGSTEEGFRLLSAGKIWKIEPAEMDANARAAMLAMATGVKDTSGRSRGFFMLVQGNSSSSSGEILARFSSAAWLGGRLKDAKSPAEIFPAEFVAQLKTANPALGEFMEDFQKPMTGEELVALWKSDLLKSSDNRLAETLRPLVLKRMASSPGAIKFFVAQISAIEPGSVVTIRGNNDNEATAGLFKAAISAAAMGKPVDMDVVAKAITRAVFGETVDFTKDAKNQMNYRRVNFMESLVQQAAQEPLEMVRLQGAFFRLGVPLDNDDYSAARPFNNKRFNKAEEAIAFLESLGWLSNADTWEPYAGYLYQANSNGSDITITLQPKLWLERAVQSLANGGLNRGELVKALQARKDGRFGSLMIAAAISRGKERSDLAGQAFGEAAKDLAKLPAAKVESLALVLPWLDEKARAKLPEKFRSKAAEIERKLRDDAVKQADEFLAKMASSGGGDVLYQIREQVKALIPYDLDKAVEVFGVAEQAYTDSLATGGTYSNSSSGEWKYSTRDYVFNDLFDESDLFASKPDLRLRFLVKVLASPTGKRLVFDSSQGSSNNSFSMAASAYLPRSEGGAADIVDAVTTFRGLDPALRPVALPGFLMVLGSRQRQLNPKQVEEATAQLKKIAEGDAEAGKLATAALAMWTWPQSTPEQKSAAREMFAAMISDPTVPDVERLALATLFLRHFTSEDFLRGPVPAALTKMFQDYGAGERSAVNVVTAGFFSALVKRPFRDDSVAPMYAALATAFWQNALTPKAAGHSPVPSELARDVFLTSLFGKDDAAITKDFGKARPALVGRLSAMIFLAQAGRTDLAKQLAPLPNEPLFREDPQTMRYDKAMETVLADLRAADVDAITLQKMELAMVSWEVADKDAAPAETLDQRVARLIDEVAATPPPDGQLPLALRALLAKSADDAKLQPLLLAWAKKHPFADFVERDRNGSTQGSENARETGLWLHGRAAMHALAAGDVELLKAMTEVAEAPVSGRGNSAYYRSQAFRIASAPMTRAVVGDVAAGHTEGYRAGLSAWNDFAVQHSEAVARYDSSSVGQVLVLSNFLARWAGDLPAFQEMVKRLPKEPEGVAERAGEGFLLQKFADDRNAMSGQGRGFFSHVFVRPGFADLYGKNIGWVARLRKANLAEAIDAIALDLPKDTVRDALPELREQAGDLRREKDPEGAIAEYRAALESCPPGDEWKATRGVMKWKAADLLLTQGKKDEAKELFLTIAPDEIAGWLKDRYNDLAKKLDVKQEN